MPLVLMVRLTTKHCDYETHEAIFNRFDAVCQPVVLFLWL